ncbi:MAG TPA: sugar phosphate isomerase/epimerase family protein [Gemmataceae bacterium]|jgi:sugar phosphate isomerase/epimerase
MRLGVGSYTYVWSVGVPGYPPPRPLTAPQLLAKAAELGVRVVQIADNLPLDRLTDAERDDLIAAARRLGIELEVGTRGCRPDHLRQHLRIAERLASPILRTVLDADGHEPTPDEAVALLRTVAPDFERAGVRLAVENHDRFRAAVLADIFERVDSAAVGLCLDTANSIGCVENVETLLRVLGRWVVNLHVKDYAITRLPHGKGFVVEGRPAGQGQLDVPGVLAELRRQGRDVTAIAELWPPPEGAPPESAAQEEAWARESVRYLRRFIPD